MIQTRKTGSTISCLRPRTADRARLPVTMPRNSDSDMCRAGQSIASMQSDTGLDEHGRLHGVSDLSNDFADLRTSASNSWSFSAKERKRRWRILAQKRSQIRWRDKSAAVGRGAGGWFRSVICDGTHIAPAALISKSSLLSNRLATALGVLRCFRSVTRFRPDVLRRPDEHRCI